MPYSFILTLNPSLFIMFWEICVCNNVRCYKASGALGKVLIDHGYNNLVVEYARYEVIFVVL